MVNNHLCLAKRVKLLRGKQYIIHFFFFLFLYVEITYSQEPSTTPLIYPFAEWEIEHSGYSGNPYDIIATVTFTHTTTNEQIETEMFYDGDWDWETESKGSTDIFKFRFSGTRLGEWTYSTSSDESALDRQTGSIEVVEQNDAALARGFIGRDGQKWVWTGSSEAFIPRQVIIGYVTPFYLGDQSRMDDDITEFIDGHGFNGFNWQKSYLWFDPNNRMSGDIPNVGNASLSPSVQSFEVVENFIMKAYEAGAYVHFLEWGDAAGDTQGNPNTLSGGVNGTVHQRLQRYIAARLGALPGWTIGFGFDVSEVTTGTELVVWETYYDEKLGWNHIIGARAHTNDEPVTNVMTDQLDYMGHEDHATINYNGNIVYNRFVDWLDEYPNMIHLSEDKFRGGGYSSSFASRVFSEQRHIRTLWHTAMAGGVGALYGFADESGNWDQVFHRSFPFSNKNEFKIFDEFWDGRFLNSLERNNSITDGYGLSTPFKNNIIIYKEETSSIDIDLSNVSIVTAIAVNTRASSYTEMDISDNLTSNASNTWSAPGSSDWALYINTESEGSGSSPNSPPTIDQITPHPTSATVAYSGNDVSNTDSYEYRLDGGDPVTIGTTNPFDIDNLTAETSYDLEMRAINSEGASNWSEISAFTTLATPEEIPDEVVLMQNYPNPFNPGTTIRYGIPETSGVRLEIFDMAGKRVAILIDEQQSAGFHEIGFNGSNIPSGAYIYRIRADNQVLSRKFMLIK